jgi:hypothetical protein
VLLYFLNYLHYGKGNYSNRLWANDKNETVFAELIQFLDEHTLSLVITEAKDDGRKDFQIVREFYAGSSNLRVITLYNQLTTLTKGNSETVTDYMIHAERAMSALRSANEQVSDALLIAMVLKGLPDEYKAFVAVVTQSATVDTFKKFKQPLHDFDETESTHSKMGKGRGKTIICFNCGIAGHKAVDCRIAQEKRSGAMSANFQPIATNHVANRIVIKPIKVKTVKTLHLIQQNIILN